MIGIIIAFVFIWFAITMLVIPLLPTKQKPKEDGLAAAIRKEVDKAVKELKK